MKKTLIIVLLTLSIFTFNTATVSASNTSGNEDWYTESIVADAIYDSITYGGVYVNTFTFPKDTAKLEDESIYSCKFWFEHDSIISYDASNFTLVDLRNIKFIGTDTSTPYTIQVKGTITASYGFLCLGRKTLDNQVITVELEPTMENFYESCGTFDLSCQAEVVSKGVGQLPDTIENVKETTNYIDALVGGFPAIEFATGLFFIGAVLVIRKWFS